ncbi:hypothetical protein BU25DRAFT_411282 [Macroventuria anomochaeta]|uniref:Uncharacterized protein n=1 Tax=Macroventuria anomochaeta TaxID=301207 RepID=A0ACB6S0N0_9PLEO|nr:uncharacterized protein BU25DRAFT_411282 [Macroventuria anomochaeta]KAF2627220.1 hypothetical protein BU25DRAFT_411282 [Macroventuria anomochaeta]
MASVVVALGVIVYFSAKKVHDHREKKRELKAQEFLSHDMTEKMATSDELSNHLETDDNLPAYRREPRLPRYTEDEQPTTVVSKKRNALLGSFRF